MKVPEKNFLFLTRWVFFALALSLFLLPGIQFAEENILSIQGKGGVPYFDLQGNLKIVYINSYGGISLATVQEEDPVKWISIQDIKYTNNVHFIRTKKDGTGRIWLAWEEREAEESDIYAAALKNGRTVNQINLTADKNGFNFSPHMDFSFSNELWVVWINYSQKKYTILVRNMTTGQIWEIDPPLNSSVLNPHIQIDGTGRIWLFWVGQPKDRDEILYTHFDGERWKEPLSLNQYSDVPHVTPSVSLDINGFPHVVWSAFNGNDYKLCYSHWDGYKWTQEKKITDSQNIADTCPSISLLFNTIPIVAWSRYVEGKREICLIYKSDEEWSPEIRIYGDKNAILPPKITSSGEKIAILWQEEAEIKTTLINFYKLLEFSFPKKKKGDFTKILSPDFLRRLALDIDKYTGYGDSITYGVIGYEGAPEKGYVPRLEELIDENIRESEVINRGVGGEATSEGLSRINSVINEDQAKTIFLMEGTNDAKDSNISMDTAAFNLRTMAETCLNFGMDVFLASIIPKDPWEGLLKERILDLNEKIKSTAADLDIPFVDQYEAFTNYQAGWGTLYSDATHPNEQGYQLMAETWYDALVRTIPFIELDKTSLTFEAIGGGSNPSSQVFNVRNSGGGVLAYEISPDQEWISVSPESGDSDGEWDEIEVSVDISDLARGEHEASITVSDSNAPNRPQILTIYLTILGPRIELDRTSLSFDGVQGESNPSSQTFQIRNSGAETLNYQISADKEWINILPESGDSTGKWDEIEVSVNISNLTRGDYEGNVSISAENASNSPQVLTIQLTILSPTIELDKSSLSFEGTIGEENPSPQTFRIRNSGAGTLNYQISADQEWITVSPESGDSTGKWDEIEVSVDISNLFKENYQGNITVSAENTSNSPQKIEINLSIKLPLLFPPIDFHGEKKKNRSLSQLEYINILKWASNPQNKFIEKYKIYIVEGENKILLIEIDAQTFEYRHRKVEGNKVQKYGLTAGDKFGRESETVYIEIR